MKKDKVNIMVIDVEELRSVLTSVVDEALSTATGSAHFIRQFNWVSNMKAAELLEMSTKQLHYYRMKGEIPYSKIERKVYYRLQDLEKFLETRRQYQ